MPITKISIQNLEIPKTNNTKNVWESETAYRSKSAPLKFVQQLETGFATICTQR